MQEALSDFDTLKPIRKRQPSKKKLHEHMTLQKLDSFNKIKEDITL
jgi:hypothetical protein